jgi:endonuclease YncB( thermonuclease family)
MKSSLRILAILGLSATCMVAQVPQLVRFETGPPDAPLPVSMLPTAGVELIEGKVVEVESGDSFLIKSDGNIQSVKLLLVDAPDLGQIHFDESRKALSRLIRKKEVRVVVHAADTAGTFHGNVYQKGRDVGLLLVEMGMAWYFDRHAETESAAGRQAYADAQASASMAREGLWLDRKPEAPWIFRHEQPVRDIVKAETSAPTRDREYILGPHDDCYYVAENGQKVYQQDKSLCQAPGTLP